METFAILSHRDLFRQEASWDECHKLLAGVSLESLQKYASNYCHRLTYGDALHPGIEAFLRFQHWFLSNYSSNALSGRILELLKHRRAYREKSWTLTDPHRMANLVAAHMVANPAPPPGEATYEDMDRLVRAQLMVNDLVSYSRASALERMGIAEVLRAFSMAQRPDAFSHLPRTFELFAERLPAAYQELESRLTARFGVRFMEVLVFLFTLYHHFLAALDPEVRETGAIPKPHWSRGVVNFSALSANHPGEAAMERVIGLYSGTWAEIREALSTRGVDDVSILPFLRRPFIRLDKAKVWCFDPALVLMAATNGLFWLAVREGGGGTALIRAFGGIFEQYLADFFKRLAAGNVRRGDDEGKGLPDFFWMEDGVLVAMEAKANIMEDTVKWAGDELQIRKSMDAKIIKDNQLMRAVERLFRHDPKLASTVTRVVPVFVVLDMSFASPGLETLLNTAIEKPNIGLSVEDAHLLWVGEVEATGNFVRQGLFSKLLTARRQVGHGSVSLGELLNRYQADVRAHVGRSVKPYDAQESARERLNEKMRKLAEELSVAIIE